MEEIIPSIGMSGRWKLRPPLNSLLLQEAVYTCRAVRSISSYLANNEDPYKSIYLPLGLSETAYTDDYTAGVSIASLQTNEGAWISIPCTYIAEYPDNTGVLYQSMQVNVILRKIPKDMDLKLYVDKITADTFEMLGMYPAVNVEPVGTTVMLDVKESDNLISERWNNISYKQTDRMRLRILEEQNTALVALLNRLKDCVTLTCLYTTDRTGSITPMDLYQMKLDPPMTPKDLFLYSDMQDGEELFYLEEDSITPPDLTTFRPVIPMTAKYMLLCENVYTDPRVNVNNMK